MDTSHKLLSLLELYENTIDEQHCEYVLTNFKNVVNYEKPDLIPLRVAYPEKRFISYSIKEIHNDKAKMMYNELILCSNALFIKDYSLPMIRANYGVGTLPSLFGAVSKIVGNNMPWVQHIQDRQTLIRIIEKGIPDLSSGFGAQVVETQQFYNETLKQFPKCSKHIKIYHPDLQGPLDVAHLLIGSNIYYDLYDEPEMIKNLLELITDTYIAFMKKLKLTCNDEIDENIYHFWTLYKGKVSLRNDTAVNLSPDMYDEFSKPYEQKIVDAFGTGSFHYCGKKPVWLENMLSINNAQSFNIGRVPSIKYGVSFLNEILDIIKEKKVFLGMYRLDEDLFNIDFKKYFTGYSIAYEANDMYEAVRILDRYNCAYR